MSVASCSSNSAGERETTTTAATTEETTATSEEETSEETTEETSEETTTIEETTEETTSETTVETTWETTLVDDPVIDEFTDPEVRYRASLYISDGYRVEAIGENSSLAADGMTEGFAAIAEGDTPFTSDYVFKFPDRETLDAFLADFDGGSFGPVEWMNDYNFSFAEGRGLGTRMDNNVLILVID
jgi:hypothetical protein